MLRDVHPQRRSAGARLVGLLLDSATGVPAQAPIELRLWRSPGLLVVQLHSASGLRMADDGRPLLERLADRWDMKTRGERCGSRSAPTCRGLPRSELSATAAVDGRGSRSCGSASDATSPVLATRSQAAEERETVQSVRARTAWIKHAGGQRHEVALTFDDGPGPVHESEAHRTAMTAKGRRDEIDVQTKRVSLAGSSRLPWRSWRAPCPTRQASLARVR